MSHFHPSNPYYIAPPHPSNPFADGSLSSSDAVYSGEWEVARSVAESIKSAPDLAHSKTKGRSKPTWKLLKKVSNCLKNTMSNPNPYQELNALNDNHGVNREALNIPMIGEQNAVTIGFNPGNIVIVSIHSPPTSGSEPTSFRRSFILDQNATLQASIDYVCAEWLINLNEVYLTAKNHDSNEQPTLVFASQVVLELLDSPCENLYIMMNLRRNDASYPYGYDIMERAHRAGRIESRTYPDSLPPTTNTGRLLLIVTFQGVIEAQLDVNEHQTLQDLSHEIASHFGKDLLRCSFFRGETRLDNESTPATLYMYTNQRIRMFDCGQGSFEFFL